MERKIKILFYNLDISGVNYFRTLTPATQLMKDYTDDVDVIINNKLNYDDNLMDYLKTFDIIHYHKVLLNFTKMMELKQSGIKLVMDIDDYWHLNPSHPIYAATIQNNIPAATVENLKIADYVTTTTKLFADEIKKVTGKDNVIVLPNSIDPNWMSQFKDNWKPDPNGVVRITYAGGSSHLHDLQQLSGVFNVLYNDPDLKGRFRVILAGWDMRGSKTDIEFNKEFGDTLIKEKLWNPKLVTQLQYCGGDIDKLNLPNEIKDRFRGKVYNQHRRPLRPNESMYYQYEKILTDDLRLIGDEQYKKFLLEYQPYIDYPIPQSYKRVWTQETNMYANVLNETDIVIAPLDNNKFNTMKSNLKQVECWTRKLPVVCNDMPPYNVDGKHMENCILIPTKKNARKYWQKYLKKLILDSELRKKLGEQLYEDFKIIYNLEHITKIRFNFYKNILK